MRRGFAVRVARLSVEYVLWYVCQQKTLTSRIQQAERSRLFSYTYHLTFNYLTLFQICFTFESLTLNFEKSKEVRYGRKITNSEDFSKS